MRLTDYKDQIELEKPYLFPEEPPLSETDKHHIIDLLLKVLIQTEELQTIPQIPESYGEKRQLLRAMMNIRPPEAIDPGFLDNINRLLRDETRRKPLVDVDDIETVADLIPNSRLNQRGSISLWKGDIALLKTDAIVNAANNQLLGCFHPLHNCIDNIIHTAAGPSLRDDCKTIMDISGQPEETGDAKITRAYNLPSRFVLHTVGPIIQEKPVPPHQRDQLASCYQNCLDLASQIDSIQTIAFPCISTGVFCFPKDQASEIAVQTVEEWLNAHEGRFKRVIFNVFLQEDFDGYFSTFQQFGS